MYLFHICTIISEILIVITILICFVVILSKLTEPHENVGLLYQHSYNENYLCNKWVYIFLIFNVLCFLFYKKIKKLRLVDYYKYEINFYKYLLNDADFNDQYEEKEFKKELSKYSRLLKLELLK